MKNFEEIFSKIEFDSNEPEDGHFQRFYKKLHEQKNAEKRKQFQIFLRTAAIFLLLIGTSIIFYKEYKTKILLNENNKTSLSEISPEYKEVEQYLRSDVENKLQQLEKLKCEKNGINKSEIIKEIQNIENQYKNLENELYFNTEDERIINAMINSYRIKSEMLEKILKTINKNCS